MTTPTASFGESTTGFQHENFDWNKSIKLYEDTDHFLDLFWDNIDSAKHIIWLTTYEIDHKLVSKITVNKLWNASKRGVKVYMILEDLNWYLDKKQELQLIQSGVVVVKHNPFKRFYNHIFQWNTRRIFNRNHHKVMLVDNNIYTGSLNIAQRYTSKKYGLRAFRDLWILVKDHKAKYQTIDFIYDGLVTNKNYIDNFNEEETKKVFADIRNLYKLQDKQKEESKPILETVELIREEPPSLLEISTNMVDLAKNAKHKIRIIQPYIQNIKEFEDAVEDALKRNVDVEIISARKRDQPIYSSQLNADLFHRLLVAGAKVYEEPYKYLHMKAICVDDKYLSMGSFNQDNTSFYCNNEANLLITRHISDENKIGSIPTFDKVFNNLKSEWIHLFKKFS